MPRGSLKKGGWRQASILDTVFEGSVEAGRREGHSADSGKGTRNGEATPILDPTDPFRLAFRLPGIPDLWKPELDAGRGDRFYPLSCHCK